MINQSTTDKLIEMRLTAMADAFRIQMDDSSMKDISFEERFGMLVDVEYTSRKNNRLKRIIRNAEHERMSMPVLPALTIVQDESSIRNSSNVSPPANTLQSIGTSLLPVQPEAARHTWPVLSAWKPASSITQ